MKNVRMYLSAVAIFAVVGSALAFKTTNFFGQGTIFCQNTCTTKIDRKLDANGLFTKVCGTTAGIENTEYQLVTGTCTALTTGLKYSSTPSGK